MMWSSLLSPEERFSADVIPQRPIRRRTIWTFTSCGHSLQSLTATISALSERSRGKIEQLRYEVEKARLRLNTITLKLDNWKALADQSEEYFAFMDKAEPTPSDELRLKMYKPVLESNSIVSRSNYDYLKNVVSETALKSATLKGKFERRRQLCELHSEIAKTYYNISQVGLYLTAC